MCRGRGGVPEPVLLPYPLPLPLPLFSTAFLLSVPPCLRGEFPLPILLFSSLLSSSSSSFPPPRGARGGASAPRVRERRPAHPRAALRRLPWAREVERRAASRYARGSAEGRKEGRGHRPREGCGEPAHPPRPRGLEAPDAPQGRPPRSRRDRCHRALDRCRRAPLGHAGLLRARGRVTELQHALR